MSHPNLRCALLLGALGLTAAGTVDLARADVWKEARIEMDQLPEDTDASWARLGDGVAFLLPDETLVVNDNSNFDNIGYTALLGEIEAKHRVTLSVRAKVLSNLGGDAVTMEVSRPGLEGILQLFPDRVVLHERRGTGRYRWLGTAQVDLSDFVDITLTKASRVDDPNESLTVEVNGVELLNVKPHADGQLGVGRLFLGSTSYDQVGASFWDWVSYRVETVESGGVANEAMSFGDFKSRF